MTAVKTRPERTENGELSTDHAYQTSKSTKTVLHSLVFRIENSLVSPVMYVCCLTGWLNKENLFTQGCANDSVVFVWEKFKRKRLVVNSNKVDLVISSPIGRD